VELGVPQPNEVIRLQNRRLRIRTPLGTLVSYNPILFVRCLGEAVWFPAVAASPTTVQVLVTLSRVAVPGMEPGALAAMRLRPSGTPLRRLGGLSYQAGPPFALSGGTDHRPFPNGPAYALYKVQTNQTATDAAKAGALVAVDTAIILV